MVNPYYEHFKSFTGAGFIPADQIGDVYRSVMYQRGYGIGNDFDYSSVHGLGFVDGILRMFRMAMPAMKTGLQYLGKQAVATAADVATDAIMGKNVKDSATEHFSTAAKDLIARAPALLQQQNKRQGTKRRPVSRAEGSTAGARKAKKHRLGRGLAETYPGLQFF